MNILSMTKPSTKKLVLIIGTLLFVFIALKAQAATSSVTLNNEFGKDGNTINIHSGNAYITGSNYNSTYHMWAQVKKSIAIWPDPVSWSRYLSPKTSWSGSVNFDASSYYVRAEGFNINTSGIALISGKLSAID